MQRSIAQKRVYLILPLVGITENLEELFEVFGPTPKNFGGILIQRASDSKTNQKLFPQKK